MTPEEWDNLAEGDIIYSKRSRRIVLKVMRGGIRITPSKWNKDGYVFYDKSYRKYLFLSPKNKISKTLARTDR